MTLRDAAERWRLHACIGRALTPKRVYRRRSAGCGQPTSRAPASSVAPPS